MLKIVDSSGRNESGKKMFLKSHTNDIFYIRTQMTFFLYFKKFKCNFDFFGFDQNSAMFGDRAMLGDMMGYSICNVMHKIEML